MCVLIVQVAFDFILDTIVQEKLLTSPDSRPFLKPVSGKAAKDYLEIIRAPMDLATLAKKVKSENKQEICELQLFNYWSVPTFN